MKTLHQFINTRAHENNQGGLLLNQSATFRREFRFLKFHDFKLKKALAFVLLACFFCSSAFADVDSKIVTSPKAKLSISLNKHWTASVFDSFSQDIRPEIIVEKIVLSSESFNAFATIDIWQAGSNTLLVDWINQHSSGILTTTLNDMTYSKVGLFDTYTYKMTKLCEDCNQADDFIETILQVEHLIVRVVSQGIEIESHHYELLEIIKSFSIDNSDEYIQHGTDYDQFVKANCGGYNGNDCGGSNPYPCCSYNGNSNAGNCTWWAWRSARCNWSISLPSPWRHAKYWAGDLTSNGFIVSATPVVNSIACSSTGSYGHVAWVTSFTSTHVTVTEMNCGSMYGMRTKTYTRAFFNKGYVVPPALLKLNSSISVNPNPIVQDQSVTVNVSVKNTGSQSFNGSVAAALHSTSGAFLGDIEIKNNVSISANGTKSLSFTKSQITSNPGSYKIFIKSKPNGGGTWSDIAAGSYTNPINITIVAGGASCNAPTGVYSSNVGKTSARINWNLVANAQNIKLQYRKSTTSSWTTLTLPGNYYYKVLTGLTKNTKYYVRLQTVCSSGTSSYSNTISFTTTNSKGPDREEPILSEEEMELHVFPNPAQDVVNIKLIPANEEYHSQVIITNAIGKVMIETSIDRHETSIPVGHLAKGVYFVKVITGKQEFFKKLVLR